jgi:hypothetical protein
VRPAAALVGLALAASPAAAEVTVRVTGGHVDLAATAAPLAEVLDRLGRQTGMKVVYEGPAPRQLVTLSIQGRTPAETVLSVLEGLGVNFALVADPSGAGVQTLIVAGASTATAAASSPAPARAPSGPRRPFGPPLGSSPDTGDPGLEEEEEDVPEDSGIPILPPGGEMADPGAAPDAGPAPGANAAPRLPGNVPLPPASPMPGFSASPFTPQPQPFPVPPASAPAPAAPNPEENPASTVPPPP